ncbi:MAG TPA: type I restriction-modification system subunit M N-terminal domain-containing protein [Enterococcus hirae]|nr:type I restriction-modification system subunit M N-terminal domain-containing protein [Enterococcus hirae]
MRSRFLEKASGFAFYNTSMFTFDTLIADANNIEENFRAYLNGFSDNMQDILSNFKFEQEITNMAENNMLFAVITEFNKTSS